jgi:glycosyltransferase involved in cell wall biosynthesis/SAM-dependent methyltransferase
MTPGVRANPPAVSVIIIFLDAEWFLDEAVQSVLAQTYSDWELLLVDDGSTDGSPARALRYAQQHPHRIRYLQHGDRGNHGMSASRNLGLRHARGRYVAWLDADDVWLPAKLERQVAILDARPEAGMTYCPTQWWYSWTSPPQDGQRDFVLPTGQPAESIILPPALLVQFLQSEEHSPCMCSILVRREVAERVGGFEDRFRGMYEDQAFCAKICLDTRVFVSGDCWCRYRQHSASASALTQRAGRHRAARRLFLGWLATYLSATGVKDRRVWQTLMRERWHCRFPRLARVLRNVQSARGALAARARTWQWTLRRLPVARQLRWLRLRRLAPLNSGRQTGTAVVRYYWARFLERHRSDIRGAGLEIGTTDTLRRYGGDALSRADALDVAAHGPEITVVADLARADGVPADQYDCFVNQFTMHLIYDVEAALYHSVRILKPGGVLLVNFPCVDYYFPRGLDMGTGRPMFMYWWFTPLHVENLLRRAGLPPGVCRVEIYGNLLARVAYQMNLPAEELTRRELDVVDPGHPLLICVRAVKPTDWRAVVPAYRGSWQPETTPAQWSPLTGHYAP